jgi:hypothetical protein
MSEAWKNVQLKCEYFKAENCNAIVTNDEAKAARHEGCENNNENACCYVCPFYHNCDISCTILGEKRCPSCGSEMQCAKMNLRIGGWTGLWKLAPFGEIGELGEDLLPVTAYSCSKCNRLEFFTERKAKPKNQNEP